MLQSKAGSSRMAAKIKSGDLVRIPTRRGVVVPVTQYLYGTVLETKYPMKDDRDWSDHLIRWHDGSNPTWEWCGDLDWVADE